MVESDLHNQELPLCEKVFRQDILNEKCVWVNQKKRDFAYFLNSRHPLIACILCPEKHPYSRTNRRGTLIIMFSLGPFWAFISCLLALYGAQSVGINVNVKGITESREVFILRLLCSMGNGIVLWFCDVSLTKMQSCVCAERQRSTHCYLLCKVFASMTIWIYFAVSFVIFSFSLYMVVISKLIWMFLMVYSLQFLCSWLFQFIGLYIRFRRCWLRDHEMVEQADKKCRYYLTYKDYEEYRYSNKLNEISPCESARFVHKNTESKIKAKDLKKMKASISMKVAPLLLEIEEDAENKQEDIEIEESQSTRFSF